MFSKIKPPSRDLVPIDDVIAARLIYAVTAFAFIAAPATASPPTISGPAYVIDGDTVVVAGVHVRLKGVDAAEMNSPLGQAARETMIGIVGNSELSCVLTGEKTHHREVGYCFTADDVDINQAIIAAGAALACPRFDTRYVEFEQAGAVAVQPRASYCVRRGAGRVLR